MKKLLILSVGVMVALAIPAYAARNDSAGQNGNAGQGASQQEVNPMISKTPGTGNQIQNQNQIQIQNMGEEQQLQIQTQQQQTTQAGPGGANANMNRNSNAMQKMGEVATQVQQMLQIQDEGGIGDQVRQIANEQGQAQGQMQQQMEKINARTGLKKMLLGTDYGAVKNLKMQLQQNQLRITQLEQIQTQLSNEADTSMVQSTIQAMIEQNTALEEQINAEENTKSMFGWFFRFLAQ